MPWGSDDSTDWPEHPPFRLLSAVALQPLLSAAAPLGAAHPAVLLSQVYQLISP